MNGSMLTNLVTLIKWINSLKDTNYQNPHKEKQIVEQICLLQTEALGLDDFTGGLHQTFKEEMILLSTTSSRKHRQREHFLTHSMRPALLYCQNKKRHYKKGQCKTIILHVYKCKHPQQSISKSNSAMYKKNCSCSQHEQVGFSSGL